MTRTGAVVAADGVVASYRGMFRRERVLRGASLDASPGTITAIVGPNGAGKTTLFSVLMGFMRPDGGSVAVDGLDPDRFRRAFGIGYLTEAAEFPAGWSVRRILGRAADLSCPPPDRREAFVQSVERAGLDEQALAKPVRSCSKGIQRRVALAWARCGDPRLLILDEPFSGLDPPSRAGLREQLRAARSSGATVLMASHDLAEVERLADSTLILAGGRLRPPAAVGASQSVAEALESELL